MDNQKCYKVIGVNYYLPIELVIIGVMLTLLITVYTIQRCMKRQAREDRHIAAPMEDDNVQRLVAPPMLKQPVNF